MAQIAHCEIVQGSLSCFNKSELKKYDNCKTQIFKKL